MMSVTSLLLLAFITSTVYGLESTREHFLKWLWPTSGYFPNGNLEERVARLEKALSEGLQKLQNELDYQRARNDILQNLLEQQDTKLKDQDTSIKELSKSISKLRETASIQIGKIKLLEEFAMKCEKGNISINDGDTTMYLNATKNKVTERSSESRQQILNEKESRLVTPYVLNVKREMNTKIKKQIRDGQVAFYATVSVANVINLGEHHTIVFDNVITNVGEAYHGGTGIFVAPVNGIYFFSVTALFLAHKNQNLELVMDGVPINHFFADDFRADADSQMTEAHIFVLEVRQGSDIWVRTVGAGDIRGNHHTTLCGWLLIPL